MPIYEFYCPDCHTVFSFFARTVNTTKRPACPRCERPDLERRMSSFAISRGQTTESPEGSEADPMPDFDEAKLEQVMEELGREAEGANEDDPRQMARMMRKLCESTGQSLDGRMEEAIRRMEAGEDPEAIEADLGDFMEEESAGEESAPGKKGKGRLSGLLRRHRPPEVDETLYDL